MKKADEILYRLMSWCRSLGYDIVIPNFYHGLFEMDLFKLTKSGQLYEYEIKISRSDFFADSKKANGHAKKHELICNGKHCNRFYYVVPDGLISKEECPDFAGLIYYKDGHFNLIKDAKKFNYKHNVDFRSLAQSISFREQSQKSKYRIEKNRNELLVKKLELLRQKYKNEPLLFYIN